MPAPPLTHHEILELVEPFTRQGRRVDLAASDRIERRLRFKPVEHAAGATTEGLQEILEFDSGENGYCRLTRRLGHPGGLVASLEADGRQAAAQLLDRIAAIDPASQFRSGEGFLTALSYRLASGDRAAAATPILTRGEARVGGLTLILKADTVRGYPAEIEMRAAEGDDIELPEDLLAVLGWDWARLARERDGWSSKLRLRGSESERSRQAEAKLQQAVEHLAQTLAEPPCRFHQQRVLARWGVALRRALPLAGGFALVAASAGAAQLPLAQDSAVRMLIFNLPPILLALAFCLKELPRFEIPPLPRASTTPAWRTARAGIEPGIDSQQQTGSGAAQP